MAKFLVQAANRPGFDGAFRAGRKWPSIAPVEIEVLDQDADPAVDPDDKKNIRIGQKTFKVLANDPFLNVRAPGDALLQQQTLEAQAAEIASLKAQLAKYESAEVEETGTRRSSKRG